MKEKLKVLSVLMLASVVFSGALFVNEMFDVIVPSWSENGVDLYVYVLAVIVLASVVFKFSVGILGLTALAKNTDVTVQQKKLTLSGKLAVPVVACGLVCLFIKLMYADQFLVIDIFDIALDILLGFMFIICSMFIRAGRE